MITPQRVAELAAHLVPGPVRHAIIDQAARELRAEADTYLNLYGPRDTRGIAFRDAADWLSEKAWIRSTL